MQDRRIVFSFNVVLFLYFCTNYLVTFLFEPNLDEKVPWDKVYKIFPNLSVILAFTIGVGLLLWGAKLLELFWNRLVSELLKTRNISFQESLAITLVISTIFM